MLIQYMVNMETTRSLVEQEQMSFGETTGLESLIQRQQRLMEWDLRLACSLEKTTSMETMVTT